eukprot:Rhum_TRINITY_DN14532_c0_g1::Rhum_TRINITY_DN14532_c0_g1_i1::g.93606::m.93606
MLGCVCVCSARSHSGLKVCDNFLRAACLVRRSDPNGLNRLQNGVVGDLPVRVADGVVPPLLDPVGDCKVASTHRFAEVRQDKVNVRRKDCLLVRNEVLQVLRLTQRVERNRGSQGRRVLRTHLVGEGVQKGLVEQVGVARRAQGSQAAHHVRRVRGRLVDRTHGIPRLATLVCLQHCTENAATQVGRQHRVVAGRDVGVEAPAGLLQERGVSGASQHRDDAAAKLLPAVRVRGLVIPPETLTQLLQEACQVRVDQVSARGVPPKHPPHARDRRKDVRPQVNVLGVGEARRDPEHVGRAGVTDLGEGSDVADDVHLVGGTHRVGAQHLLQIRQHVVAVGDAAKRCLVPVQLHPLRVGIDGQHADRSFDEVSRHSLVRSHLHGDAP